MSLLGTDVGYSHSIEAVNGEIAWWQNALRMIVKTAHYLSTKNELQFIM